MNKGLVSLIAFSLGIGTGMALGVLFAPEDGKSTRDKWSFRLGKYRDQLAELVAQLREHQEEPANAARSEGQRVISDTKDQAEKLLNDVESLIGQIKKQPR